jgi:IS605 OrfB family transposase
MVLTACLQNHLRLDKATFKLFQQISRYSKDLYNAALYIQRKYFFKCKKFYSLGKLFAEIKQSQEYLKLPSDLAQQVLIQVNQNLKSFIELLKAKKKGTYTNKVRLPNYLDKDGYNLLTFISRLMKLEHSSNIDKVDKVDSLRLSLGYRGLKSTGTRYIYFKGPPLGIEPKQIRIVPRYKAHYFDIEYVYETAIIPRDQDALPNSYLSIDLGLNNFATCTTTTGTAFIIEGSGIVSFNRWWNKSYGKYQSLINSQRITTITKRGARLQTYRKDVINNYLNHVVRYIVDFCLRHRIQSIIVGEWGDMKRGLRMRRKTSEKFQKIPYKQFKDKLKYKSELHDIEIQFQEESYTSQDCFGCGLRRKANRKYRGLYCCVKCGMELNADINGSLNIMSRVVRKDVILNNCNNCNNIDCNNYDKSNIQLDSGEITSPSRIRLVEFV